MTIEWKIQSVKLLDFCQWTSPRPISLCDTFPRFTLTFYSIYCFHSLLIHLISKRCNLFRECDPLVLLFPVSSDQPLLLYNLILSLLLLFLFKLLV